MCPNPEGGSGELHETKASKHGHVLGEKLDAALAAAKAQGLSLQPDGNWWVASASHGGIYFQGPDVWNQQKNGETPGVVVFVEGEQDGGAGWVEEEEEE